MSSLLWNTCEKFAVKTYFFLVHLNVLAFVRVHCLSMTVAEDFVVVEMQVWATDSNLRAVD